MGKVCAVSRMIVSHPYNSRELLQDGRDGWISERIHEDSGERGLVEGPFSGSYRVVLSSSLSAHLALILAMLYHPNVEIQWDEVRCEKISRLALGRNCTGGDPASWPARWTPCLFAI